MYYFRSYFMLLRNFLIIFIVYVYFCVCVFLCGSFFFFCKIFTFIDTSVSCQSYLVILCCDKINVSMFHHTTSIPLLTGNENSNNKSKIHNKNFNKMNVRKYLVYFSSPTLLSFPFPSASSS